MSDHSTKSFLTGESPQARTSGGCYQAGTNYRDKSIYRHSRSRGNGKNGPLRAPLAEAVSICPEIACRLLAGQARFAYPSCRITGVSLRSRVSVACGTPPTTTSSSSVFGLETALATAGILVVMVARIPDVFR